MPEVRKTSLDDQSCSVVLTKEVRFEKVANLEFLDLLFDEIFDDMKEGPVGDVVRYQTSSLSSFKR